MVRIERETHINCDLNKLFEFHLDSNNIKVITPKNISVELLNDDTRTFEGKIVKLNTKRAFVNIYWEVEIKKIEEPNLLHDIAIKSPFKYWSHKHIFYKDGDFSVLKDVIDFELPFGIIGKIFQNLIKKDIEDMFEYRHLKTKIFLERESE